MTSPHRTDISENELLLLAKVAHLYYIDDLKQDEIAKQVGMSRSNVSRMLKEARAQGMVEIKIQAPLSTVPGLQDELVSRLGLRECRVLAALGRSSETFESDTRTRVADLAVRYLLENLVAGDIIGLGWGRSVYRVVHSRFLREENDITVVQAMGSVGGSIPEYDGVATTARMATALGASAHYLHAPILVTDKGVRAGLLRDPHIRKTLEVARQANTMLLSIGTISREHGQYRTGYLSEADLDYIRGQGVVGEFCGTYVARDGSVIPLEMNERAIYISTEHLERIPTRIGVSSGSEKPLANIGVARSNLLDVLITDEDTARRMVDILDSESTSVS